MTTFELADKTALFTSTSCQKPHVLHELHVARDERRAGLRAAGRPTAVGRQQGLVDTYPSARATSLGRHLVPYSPHNIAQNAPLTRFLFACFRGFCSFQRAFLVRIDVFSLYIFPPTPPGILPDRCLNTRH